MLKQVMIRGVCRAGAALRAACGPRRELPCILMYHRAAVETPDTPRPTLNVTPERFGVQIEGLRRRGYRIVPLGELLDAHASVSPKSLAITFDDGFENLYTRLLPVVRELRAPITVFVCPGWFGHDGPMDFDRWGLDHWRAAPADSYRSLCLEQCQEMAATGLVDFGAHTWRHGDFRDEPDALREDLRRCVEFLRGELGVECPAFAFPFGRVDEGFATADMMDAACQAGVRCALTTEPQPLDVAGSPFGWGRYNVFPWDSAATIDARLSGWYQWLPDGRRHMRQLLGLARAPLNAPANGAEVPDGPQPTAEPEEVRG